MGYEPDQIAMRQERKEKDNEAFLTFFSENDELYKKSEKEALENLKKNSRRLKREKWILTKDGRGTDEDTIEHGNTLNSFQDGVKTTQSTTIGWTGELYTFSHQPSMMF